MDPDLVRQQAEEEAASRIYARREPPPEVRIEPFLPMPGPTMAAAGRGRTRRPAGVYESGMQAATAMATAGWRIAFGIATSCVLGTTVGLVGGMMVGVKTQLVRRAGMARMQAYGAAFRAAFTIFLIMAASMFVAPHFTGAVTVPGGAFDIAQFWRTMAGGAAASLLLGAGVIRRALRDAPYHRFDTDRR
jgi:hypothetical protein